MNAPLDKKTEQSFATAPHFPIYMDYSATTPIDPRVADKMIPYLREQFGNPASRSHAYGWEAEKAVEDARGEVAALPRPVTTFGSHQRSISPSTMSSDALIAMTSLSRCPSHSFGRAAMLMKLGPRTRQRTGLEPPSETTYMPSSPLDDSTVP